jgi:hypothetical protein
MANLHLQSLRWTSDGELHDADRVILLNTLIPQCIPSVQTELIQAVERIALSQTSPHSAGMRVLTARQDSDL